MINKTANFKISKRKEEIFEKCLRKMLERRINSINTKIIIYIIELENYNNQNITCSKINKESDYEIHSYQKELDYEFYV